MTNLSRTGASSLVVYGEPQSGKTAMMICLTAKLLDDGYDTVIHLLNDSVDLLQQSLERFRLAGLAPAPKNITELSAPLIPQGGPAIVFCKKNKHDLGALTAATAGRDSLVIVDDEADYASPNSKVNAGKKTKINELIENLLSSGGHYVGVTATPARLNLNSTFNNSAEKWVQFRPHDQYTGQDVFFGEQDVAPYRRVLLVGCS